MSTRPVIFVSYSHLDEPESPAQGEVQWLSFVRSHLQPAVKHGMFDLWVDRHMSGGSDWNREIEDKLRACHIFVLLVSANSMASDYIIDREIAIIRERQARGENVHFYPLLLTPTPAAGLKKVNDANLRPRNAVPFSSFSPHERMQHMVDAADEIAEIAATVAPITVAGPGSGTRPVISSAPSLVNIVELPETPYQHLVGRDAELARMDKAWSDPNKRILSLIAEGGAGKSSLINEWLLRMQQDNYRGASAVLAWSFYNQGTKERATSADDFFDWILAKLGIGSSLPNLNTKVDAITDAMTRRRVLLVLDGVEPLQFGPGPQFGQMRDIGVRTLLRAYASSAHSENHGLVLLSSRVAVKDIARWQETTAPVLQVTQLSDDAGAMLLRDNGVWGTEPELRETSREFGGHPLALGLLASYLSETQRGDVRRRDHVRGHLADQDNPRHDHAWRVIESYVKEWFEGQPVLLALLKLLGLFDGPVPLTTLAALRARPVIEGLTEPLVDLTEDEWERTIMRLRELRPVCMRDSEQRKLDSHPLVREWFSDHLRRTNEAAWRAGHSRLYEYLRDTTEDLENPTLEELAPLYAAVAHGCRAGRYKEALNDIMIERIFRGAENYAHDKLMAFAPNLAALFWFFERPFTVPVAELDDQEIVRLTRWVEQALFGMARFHEMIPILETIIASQERAGVWRGASLRASDLATIYVALGDMAQGTKTAERALVLAMKSADAQAEIVARAGLGHAFMNFERRADADREFRLAEKLQAGSFPQQPLLHYMPGFKYCEFLRSSHQFEAVRDRALTTIEWARAQGRFLDMCLDLLSLGGAHFGMALRNQAEKNESGARENCALVSRYLNEALDTLRRNGSILYVPRILLLRSAFLRNIGDWKGASRDLDEIDEISRSTSMKSRLASGMLERVRLLLARSENFAPLQPYSDDAPRDLLMSTAAEAELFRKEAAEQLVAGIEAIKNGGGFHGPALDRLQSVIDGKKSFAEIQLALAVGKLTPFPY